MPAPPVDRLSNGLAVVVIEAPQSHQVLVNLLVRVGSRHEPARENGVSHFLEHLLFRGNTAFADADALNRAFEEVGSMVNAHTGVEETEYYFVAHPGRVERGLACLARFVDTPTFADVDKERRILLEELSYDYNDQGLLTNLSALSSQALWPRHPLGQSVGGLPETVERLSAKVVRTHYGRYYRPENTVLALAGRVRRDEALAWAERHFGGWHPAPDGTPRPAPSAPAPREGGPDLTAVPDQDNQFHLQLAFPAPGYNDPDDVATALLARILDDGPTTRLQRTIREELALVYHIEAHSTGYWDAGAFEVATSVKAEGLPELLSQLLGLLAAFRDEGPTAEELERARMRYLFDLEFGRDSLSTQVDRYAWPLLYSTVRTEEEEVAQVQAITVERLRRLAADVLHRRRLHCVLVGPLADDTCDRVRDLLERY